MFDTTTAMGRFFITLVGAMAEWERENLAERVLVGMETKAKKGQRNGGIPPYGYARTDNGELVKNPEEGKVFMRIIDMYRNRMMGLNTIAKRLTAEGIPARDPRRRKIDVVQRKGKWSYSPYYMLQNPEYCGKIRWGEQSDSETILVDGEHEPYLTLAEFESLQNTRTSRGNGSIQLHMNFVFSHILRCGRCGYGMSGTSMDGANGVRLRYYHESRNGH